MWWKITEKLKILKILKKIIEKKTSTMWKRQKNKIWHTEKPPPPWLPERPLTTWLKIKGFPSGNTWRTQGGSTLPPGEECWLSPAPCRWSGGVGQQPETRQQAKIQLGRNFSAKNLSKKKVGGLRLKKFPAFHPSLLCLRGSNSTAPSYALQRANKRKSNLTKTLEEPITKLDELGRVKRRAFTV